MSLEGDRANNEQRGADHDDLVLRKLIRMANQIASFFLSQPEAIRAEGVATHINKFWEPRMRRHLFKHLDLGGEGLLPLVVEASALIRRPDAEAKSAPGVGDDAGAGAPGGKGVVAGESLSEPSIPDQTS